MKRPYVLVLSVCGLSACVPPAVTPPRPTTLTVQKPPAEVVAIATRELVTAGFDVAVSDAAAGTVAVTKKRVAGQFGYEIVCRFADGSIASRNGEVTLKITVNARAASGGTSVLIQANAVTSYANGVGIAKGMPDSVEDCASSSVTEKRLATALAAP